MGLFKSIIILVVSAFLSFSALAKSVEMIEGTIVRNAEGKAVIVKDTPKKQLSFYIKSETKQVPVYLNAKIQPWSFKCGKGIKFYGEFQNDVFIANAFYSQCDPEVKMADKMYEDGRIYVVLGVIGILFLGLFGFMIVTNLQLNQLKKEAKDLV